MAGFQKLENAPVPRNASAPPPASVKSTFNSTLMFNTVSFFIILIFAFRGTVIIACQIMNPICTHNRLRFRHIRM